MVGDGARRRFTDSILWTWNAVRRMWRQTTGGQGPPPGITLAATGLVVVVVALALAVSRFGTPFYKKIPAGGALVVPATKTGQAAAAAAARVPGARPVVVLTAGNTLFIGLGAAVDRKPASSRVVSAVQRAIGPPPTDEGTLNDPLEPGIVRVFVTSDQGAVQDLLAAAGRLRNGVPLADVLGDLTPAFRAAAGLR